MSMKARMKEMQRNHKTSRRSGINVFVFLNNLDKNRHRKPNTSSGAHTRKKSKNVALFLCLFLGFIGAHRFYVGKYKSGLLYLVTVGFFVIGWIKDLVAIATNSFSEDIY